MFKKIFTAVWLMLACACCQMVAAAPSISVSATPSNPIAPATVTLSVSVVTDVDPVTVTQVEYFSGATSLGVTLNAPFDLTLNDLAAATYPIVAKATTTDLNNPLLQSAPISIVVSAPQGAVSAYFIHTDQLNTPRAISNGASALVWQWDSDPFGKDAPNEQFAGQNAFVANLRFSGQYADKESGSHYNYFRDYDPALGRYIQSDPIGLRGGINTYAYALQDPMTLIDPWGLQVWQQGSLPPRVQSHNDWVNVDKQMQKEFVDRDLMIPLVPNEKPKYECRQICQSATPLSCPANIPVDSLPVRSLTGETCQQVCVTGQFLTADDSNPPGTEPGQRGPRSAGRGDWQKLFKLIKR